MNYSDTTTATTLSTTELNSRLEQAHFGDAFAAAKFVSNMASQLTLLAQKSIQAITNKPQAVDFKPANA
jgi:hypothetical protein